MMMNGLIYILSGAAQARIAKATGAEAGDALLEGVATINGSYFNG